MLYTVHGTNSFLSGWIAMGLVNRYICVLFNTTSDLNLYIIERTTTLNLQSDETR